MQQKLRTSQQRRKSQMGPKPGSINKRERHNATSECITLAPQEPRPLVALFWPEAAGKYQCVKASTITTPCLNLLCFRRFHLARSVPNSWSHLFSKHRPSRLQGGQVHIQQASNWTNIDSVELVPASTLLDHEVLQAAFHLLKGIASLILQVIT